MAVEKSRLEFRICEYAVRSIASPISWTMASRRWVRTDTVMGSIMGSSEEPAADVHLGRQRTMDRALLRDLQQPGAGVAVQPAGEDDLGVDPIEPARFRLALVAVSRVDLRVPEPHLD